MVVSVSGDVKNLDARVPGSADKSKVDFESPMS
jgi:hypothetical protein